LHADLPFYYKFAQTGDHWRDWNLRESFILVNQKRIAIGIARLSIPSNDSFFGKVT